MELCVSGYAFYKEVMKKRLKKTPVIPDEETKTLGSEGKSRGHPFWGSSWHY